MGEMNAKGIILRAFDQFRLKSCIDFKPRTSEDYYISVQKLDGYVLNHLHCPFGQFFTIMSIETISDFIIE